MVDSNPKEKAPEFEEKEEEDDLMHPSPNLSLLKDEEIGRAHV